MRSLKKTLWVGLILLIAIWLIYNVFLLLYNFLKPLRELLSLTIQHRIPGLEFAAILVIILLLGLVAQYLSKRASSKIPFVDKIIKFSKIAHDFGNRLDKGEIRSAIVRIHEDLYLLAFATGQGVEINNQEFVVVLLPSTPNPTTGYAFLVPKEKVVYLPKHLNKLALKVVLTAGLFK